MPAARPSSRDAYRSAADEILKCFPMGRRLDMESEVRQEFRRVHGIEVQQPGWAGWFRSEVRRWMLAELAARKRLAWPGLALFDASRQLSGHSKSAASHGAADTSPGVPAGAVIVPPPGQGLGRDQANLW